MSEALISADPPRFAENSARPRNSPEKSLSPQVSLKAEEQNVGNNSDLHRVS